MRQAKICGLSTPETVQAAISGGAAYLGFVHFPKSPRHLALDAAARLAAPARNKAKVVVLLVDPDDALIKQAVSVLAPDLIQLHGHESPARTAEIAARSNLPIIKALPVSDERDVLAAAVYDGPAQHLMFDARPPKDADRPGGLGAAFDWTLLKGARFSRPHFLAGGLDPWNVQEALSISGAPLADVSSGVERAPGIKDSALIGAFLDAVRRA